MASNSKRKADTEADRLNALQMADLGTARREYVSTADDGRKRLHAELDDIERHRYSNIAGTAQQRLAQANRPLLNAWTDFHKIVADTGKLEKLEDIMHGQSHRAQLSAALHGSEPLRYPTGGHVRSVSHAPTHHPYPKPSSGRGGGIVGTRTRGQSSPVRISTHIGIHTQSLKMPTRQDPALDVNNPGSPPSRGRGARRGHGKMGSPAHSHATHKARVMQSKPRKPEPTGDYAKRLTTPATFLASARASFGAPPVSSETPSIQPPKAATTLKPVTASKLSAGSPLGDSILAVPASSAPAASAAEQVPDSPSPPPRIVPFEKTAAFGSHAKAARLKPSDEAKPVDERQKKPNEQEASAVLLDIDQSAEESTAAQVRNFLFSPSMADLTGITFPKEDEVKPLGSVGANLKGEPALASADLHVSEVMLRIVGDFSGYLQKYAGKKAQPASLRFENPLEDILATTSREKLEAIAKKVVEDWLRDRRQSVSEAPGHAPPKATSIQPTLGQHDDQEPLSKAAPASSTPQPSRDQQFALPSAVPEVPKPGPAQVQRISLPKTEATSPELETDQLSKTGSFDTYRTPPRSVSGTVTDSSDEKKQRKMDASLLSPKKKNFSSDVPTVEFRSLRVSEHRTIQNAPKEPLDADLTQTEGAIARPTSKPPIFGSVESSIYASPVNVVHRINETKVGTTSEDNITLSISKAPQDAPVSWKIVRSEGPSPAVSEAQRSTLVQSSSNILEKTSIKETTPAAGPKSPQELDKKKSRVLSGGMAGSIWATPDNEPSKFATFLKRPLLESTSSRHSSMPSTKTENTASSGVRFVGPAPYMPRQK